MLRRVAALLAVTLVLAACGGAPPAEVTFRAGAASVVARPTQSCDIKMQNCQSDATAPVQLAVPAGTNLSVAVPQEVSTAPWAVVFTYRSADGSQTDGRSPVFAPNQHTDYTLVLPAPTDRLLTAQVQQFGPAPQQNADTGEIEFPTRASWVLNTTG